MKRLNKAEILRLNGWVKDKTTGKYQNPDSKRKSLYDEKRALDKISKESGYKSFDDYKTAREQKNKNERKQKRSGSYKRMADRAEKYRQKTHLGSRFSKLYAKWRKKGYKNNSQEMRDLLKSLHWLTKKNYERYA